MSSTVNSACPTVMPCRAKAAEYRATRRPWPTLAAAWEVAKSEGRRSKPRGSIPAAMAPEDINTTSVPARCALAMTSANTSIASPSKRPSSRVRDDDPILITMRLAWGRSFRDRSRAALIHLPHRLGDQSKNRILALGPARPASRPGRPCAAHALRAAQRGWGDNSHSSAHPYRADRTKVRHPKPSWAPNRRPRRYLRVRYAHQCQAGLRRQLSYFRPRDSRVYQHGQYRHTQ